MNDTDEAQIEVRNETRYYTDRFVVLKAKDPEDPFIASSENPPIEVRVGGTVSSYNPAGGAAPPALRLTPNLSCLTRKQWDLVKRLGDQAWDEYERKFLTEG